MNTVTTEVTIDWPGASGQTYRYWIYRMGTALQAKPGNYIFAKETSPGRWAPIYAGETGDLDLRFDNHHKATCITRNGATHIHAHVSSADEKVRRAEEADIVAKWNPTCNG
jgi:hypothetical protein